MRILLAEDEKSLSKAVIKILEKIITQRTLYIMAEMLLIIFYPATMTLLFWIL